METFKYSYAQSKGREERTKCYRKSQRKEFWKKGMIHSVRAERARKGRAEKLGSWVTVVSLYE